MTAGAGVATGTPASEGAGARERSRPGALVGASAALLLSMALGASLGPVSIAPTQVLKIVLGHVLSLDLHTSAALDAIVWQIRLPRVVLAAIVGATLGCSGAAYQGVFRNPLADPYLLGVASGAGLAATIVIVAGINLTFGGLSLLTLVAFFGALAAVLATYAVARVAGHAPTTTLILAGVAVSSITVSATSYLMLVNERSAISILTWLLGGFNGSGWRQVGFVLPYVVPAALVMLVHGRLLNVLQLDGGQAQQLGVDVERTRLVVLAAASLATAAAVSVAGIIGFVGLVTPHVVRLLAGPDYRRLLPLSALVGASFLVLADLAARTIISPGEVPVGVVTSFAGAPFFLFLLRQQRKAFF